MYLYWILLYKEEKNMKETKLDKQKKNLVELGVMEESDTLIDFFQASYI